MRSPARLRDRRILETQLAALGPDRGSTGDYRGSTGDYRGSTGDYRGSTGDFRRGAVHALRWLTTGGPGPLTGALVGLPVSVQAIVAELAAAEDLIYGRPGIRQDYARGVEHALM